MARRVLLVGWDSADWRVIQPLIDAGKMPVLQRLIETGVSGRLASLDPMISPLLWTSIATGKRAHAHGIYSFTATDPLTGTVESVGSRHRRCHALWNILHHEGMRSVVCNWFASHPAEPVRGLAISNEFAVVRPASQGNDASAVHPAIHDEPLRQLRTEPEDIDESIIRLLVPRAEEIDQENDSRLARLALLLAENFSVHAAFTYGLAEIDWNFAAVYYEAIDAVAHHFMRYVAPLMPGVRRIDGEIYGMVVEGTYRLHDAMLGRLIELAGTETTVCVVSDHGFHSRETRPSQLPKVPMAITLWHRRQGVLVMHGPDLRRDILVHGAGLLDIAPTILTLFDLPVGNDMEGRVLTDAFVHRPRITSIPSWDQLDGDFARVTDKAHPGKSRRDFLQRLIDLGYLADAVEPGDSAPADQRIVEQYFRALSLLDGQRLQDALPILDELHDTVPERDDIAFSLASTLMRLGLLEEAEEVIQLLEVTSASPAAFHLRADLEWRRGEVAAAAEALHRVEQTANASVQTLNFAGTTYLHLRDVPNAEVTFLRSLAREKENPGALGGLSFCRTKQRRYDEAAELALEGISLLFHHFYCHHCYGIALAHLDDRLGAIRAFENALRLNPRFHAARQYLVHLLKREPGTKDLVEKHRALLLQRALDRLGIEAARENLRRQLQTGRHERAAADAARREAAESERTPRFPPGEMIIVSGVPRSGTSLVMQLLAAAAVPLMIDEKRPPDENNPQGYYEWEPIKHLSKDPQLIGKAAGRAVKVVSPLLRFLPRQHRYRIIVMRRNLPDTVASQNRMRARLTGRTAEAAAHEVVVSDLARHLEETRTMLDGAPNVRWIEVDFEQLLARADMAFERIAEFCGIDKSFLPAMKSVILSRNDAIETADVLRP